MDLFKNIYHFVTIEFPLWVLVVLIGIFSIVGGIYINVTSEIVIFIVLLIFAFYKTRTTASSYMAKGLIVFFSAILLSLAIGFIIGDIISLFST